MHISCRFTMLLLYTVCVVKQGQSLYGVLLFFFYSIQKGWEKNKHDVSGSISVEKPKPVAFLCCKPNFYFHIHLWFLQALKQDNKRICSNVQLVSQFNLSHKNVALDLIPTTVMYLFCCSFVSLCNEKVILKNLFCFYNL